MSDSRERYSLRLDAALKGQIRSCAEMKGQTMQDFIEEAVRIHVMADSAARNDAEIAPLVAKCIHDSQREYAGTLRKLIARGGLEVLRMSYVMYHFMNHAGIDWDQLTAWHEEGWRHAVKEIKKLPISDGIDE